MGFGVIIPREPVLHRNTLIRFKLDQRTSSFNKHCPRTLQRTPQPCATNYMCQCHAGQVRKRDQSSLPSNPQTSLHGRTCPPHIHSTHILSSFSKAPPYGWLYSVIPANDKLKCEPRALYLHGQRAANLQATQASVPMRNLQLASPGWPTGTQEWQPHRDPVPLCWDLCRWHCLVGPTHTQRIFCGQPMPTRDHPRLSHF